MRNISLKNIDSQKQLDETGYVVLKSFLTEKQVLNLKKYYVESGLNAAKAQPNYLYARPELSKQITNTISLQLAESHDTWFQSAKLLGGVFMVKPAGLNKEVDFHQDWSLVDETEATSYNLWCPLTITDRETGSLILLRNSFKVGLPFRSSSLPPLELKIKNELEPFMIKFSLDAGDAILYRHSMFHGSENNRGKEDRIAIACGIIPENSDFIYQHWSQERNAVQSIAVDQDFYIEHIHDVLSGNMPERYKIIKENFFDKKPFLSENDFMSMMKKINKTRKFLFFKY